MLIRQRKIRLHLVERITYDGETSLRETALVSEYTDSPTNLPEPNLFVRMAATLKSAARMLRHRLTSKK